MSLFCYGTELYSTQLVIMNDPYARICRDDNSIQYYEQNSNMKIYYQPL